MTVFLLKHWRAFLALAFLLAVAGASYYRGRQDGADEGRAEVRALKSQHDDERVRFALEHAKAMEAQAERYRLRAESQAAVALQYQEALNDANRKHDRTVADLRSGALQLRKHWQGCEARVSEAGQVTPGGREPDADAELRAADSGNLVRIGATCDAHVKALQSILAKEREGS